jgi:hypothetical protein
VLIPVGQYPDEQSHFAQVQNTVEFGKTQLNSKNNTSYEVDLLEKAIKTSRDVRGNNSYTYHPEFNISYSVSKNGPNEAKFNSLPKLSRTTLVKREATENPPFYYYLGSYAYKLFYNSNIFERIYAIRIISVLLFMVLIIVAYKISKICFNEERILQIALPSLLAFMPMLVFASTGILPDPLTNLLFCFIIYASLKIIQSGFKISTISLLLLAFVSGLYTRQQFFISFPIIICAFLVRCLSVRNYKGISLIIITLFTPTFLFKFVNSFVPEKPASYSGIIDRHFLLYLKSTLTHWYRETLPWYWGIYRWLSLSVPHIYYQIVNRILAFAMLGTLLKLFIILKNKNLEKSDWYLIFLVCATLIYASIFIVGDYYFINQYGYSFGIQGRYFFPLITAHFAILLMGFWVLSKLILKKYAKYAVCLLVLLMILFNDLTLFHVASSYYSIETFAKFIAQASQYKPQILKGNIILYILILNITLQTVFGLYLTKKTIKNEYS